MSFYFLNVLRSSIVVGQNLAKINPMHFLTLLLLFTDSARLSEVVTDADG